MPLHFPECLAFVLLAAAGVAAEAPRAPLYTDEDLRRVSPFRDQTGVMSVPAVTPSPDAASPRAARDRSSRTGGDEAYWRREAQRHRSRQAALGRRIRSAERQLDQTRRRQSAALGRSSSSRSSASSRGSDPVRVLEERLAALHEERREEDDAFFERARRAGALPGWLRE